jgi:NAD-dependent dihydropyrimidine dehydrogenase PreA subunit
MGKINVLVDRDACIGCGACVDMCPKQILGLDGENKCVVSDQSKCDRLGGCERVCPTDAIKIQ